MSIERRGLLFAGAATALFIYLYAVTAGEVTRTADAGTETGANLGQQLAFHVLGTPQSADVTVWADPQHPTWMFGTEVTNDGRCAALRTARAGWAGWGSGRPQTGGRLWLRVRAAVVGFGTCLCPLHALPARPSDPPYTSLPTHTHSRAQVPPHQREQRLRAGQQAVVS